MKQDFVRLLILDNGKALILEQKGDREPEFILPGGHIEPGELPEQAACRELMEETGLIAEQLELIAVLPKEDKPDEVVYLYRVNKYSGNFELNLEESTRSAWINVNNFTEPLAYQVRARHLGYLKFASQAS